MDKEKCFSRRHSVGKESVAGKAGTWQVVGALVSVDVQYREGKMRVSCEECGFLS